MASIMTASPDILLLGTDDESIKSVTPEETITPMHLAKFYDFFQRGNIKNNLVDGGKLLAYYGQDSFNLNGKYYSKVKDFMSKIVGVGNAVMVKRLIPSNVDSVANATIYLDIIEDDIKKYKRNVDGSIAKDVNGDPVEDTDSPIKGYRVKLIKEIEKVLADAPLGLKTIKNGTMTDSAGNTSTMYPFEEIRGATYGEWYNNVGQAISLPTVGDVSEDFINSTKTLPFEFYLYEKVDNVNRIYKNLFKGVKASFVWKNGTTDPVTNMAIDLENTISLWSNTTDTSMTLKDKLVETPYIYSKNLETVANLVLAKEQPYINADITTNDGTVVNSSEWFDFVDSADLKDQTWLVNLFNGYSIKRVPYFGMVMDTTTATLTADQEEIMFAYNTPAFLGNGTDGDISYNSFETEFSFELDKYLDPDSEVMGLARNVENIMYDVEYNLDVKKKLINFITVRKDTFVALSTRQHIDGVKVNDIVTDRAVAINLKSRLNLAPESTYFNTGVARAIIVAGSGRVKNGLNRDYWPLLLNVALKAARMMGGTSWKTVNIFDSGYKNTIDDMYDITPDFIPQGVKPALWNLGIIWPAAYDTTRYYFEQLQTVYENDTSVLNSFFTGMALTTINKLAAQCHRHFTGTVSLKPDEFVDEVEKYLIDRIDVFGGVVKVIPRAFITSFDAARGYSWTVEFKLGANVPKTVMTSYVVAMRMNDL